MIALRTSLILLILSTIAPAAAPAAEQPQKVDLHIKAATLMEAVAQFSEQMGMPAQIQNMPVENRPVTLDLKGASPTEAFTAFLTAAQCRPVAGSSSVQMQFAPGAPIKTFQAGSLGTVMVTRVTVSANAPVGREGSPSYNYSMSALFLPDPALQLVAVEDRSLSLDSLEHDGPPSPSNNFGGGGGTMSRMRIGGLQAWNVQFEFSTSGRAAKLIKAKGRIRAWKLIESASATLDITQIEENEIVEGNQLSMQGELKEPAGRMGRLRSPQILLTLSGPVIEQYASSRFLETLGQCVTAQDAAGKPLGIASSGYNVKDKHAEIGIMFPGILGAKMFERLDTVRVVIPTKVQSIEIPLEFENIDLP